MLNLTDMIFKNYSAVRTKAMIILIVLMTPLLFSSNMNSCGEYHKCMLCRPNNARGFHVHGLSRSAVMEPGKTSSFEIDLYGGKDYIISSCTQRRYYPIHMRILNDEKEVLYDNMMDDYVESIGFTVDSLQTYEVEVTLLAEQVNPENFDENRACTGVLVMWRHAPDIGF